MITFILLTYLIFFPDCEKLNFDGSDDVREPGVSSLQRPGGGGGGRAEGFI